MNAKLNRMNMKWMSKGLLIVIFVLSGPTFAQAFYNPSAGRWLNRDPLGEVEDLNSYRFVRNDSTRFFDIDGREAATTIDVSLDGGGTVSIAVGSGFSTADRALGLKAICLVRALLPGVIFNYPVWSDTYWANLTGATDTFGITYGNKVYIDNGRKPKSELNLAAMVQFGITLAHEADHLHTGSDDGPVGPASRIDNPAQAAMGKARSEKVMCTSCDRHEPKWWIRNKMEEYACNCDINLGAGRSEE